MSNTESMANKLIEQVYALIDIKLAGVHEKVDRTARLLAQTRNEVGGDRMADQESNKGRREAMAMLVARVDSLEQWRGHVTSNGANDALMAQRHGPPPGVRDPLAGAVIHGERVVDPTTASIERSLWGLQSEKEAHARTRTRLAEALAERDKWRESSERMTKARDAALKGCDDLGSQLTKAQRDAKAAIDAGESIAQNRDNLRAALDAATRESNAIKAMCTRHSQRVRDLEDQAQRRDKLAQQRLATFESLQMRICDIANEKFGPFPVLAADVVLSAIEVGIWHDRQQIERGIQLADRLTGTPTQQAMAKAVYVRETKAGVEQRERAMAEFYGPKVEQDDCQAGTCDCPDKGASMHAGSHL